MVRKSASQFKPTAKAEAPQLPPIEETFENAKQAFINTLEVSIVLAKRVDNLLNIRDYANKFWNGELDRLLPEERMDYYKALQEISITTYEALLEATKQFTLEEFSKEELNDYYEAIIPKVESITNERQLCSAGLIFITVKPFGEKMTALHHTILDEKKQREFTEKD